MKFSVKVADVAKVSADAVVVFWDREESFSSELISLDKISDGFFSQLKKTGDLPQKGKAALFVNVPNVVAKRVIVCAVGDTPSSLRNAAQNIWKILSDHCFEKVAVAFEDSKIEQACRVILTELAQLGYRFDEFKTLDNHGKKSAKFADKVHFEWLVVDKTLEKVIKQQINFVSAWAEGSYFARDLGNTPANVCTPTWLGHQAKQLAKKYDDLDATILKKKDIVELKMGALLGVAQGSIEEPRFIVLEYKPSKIKNKKPVVLVGKGVTFDAGGISLKPAGDMDLMKYDMGGAAAVLGTMKAIAEAKLPVHVISLVPSVENLPSGSAVKPGDILTSMSGKTIEVLNTDAEGRLILCDALTYAEQYEPQAVIDVATLTGACVIALGSPRCGLFGNDEKLTAALFEAGEAACDRAWRLPIDEEYRDMMKSPFADLANISSSREAGAITAAAFLSVFAENYSWAHLDIAGVAWKTGAAKGGTGRPVGLLLEYFSRLAG